MGIYNRDYYRDSPGYSGGAGFSGTTACHQLLVITIVAYLLQNLITYPSDSWREYLEYFPPEERQVLQQMEKEGRQSEVANYIRRNFGTRHLSLLEEYGAVSPGKVMNGQVWRLLTYAFLHDRGSPWHILFNMLVLWSFGPVIEELRGKREFLIFYLVGAIVSGMCHVLFGLATKTPNPAVGASGALMSVMMVFALHYPHHPITLFFFITLEARWVMLLYLVFDLHPVILALNGSGAASTGVAHAAHLGGLAFGFLYDRNGWMFSNWLAPRAVGQQSRGGLWGWWNRPRVRVYREPPAQEPPASSRPRPVVNLDQKVDEILAKIKQHGENSLSEQERNLLREASRKYRDRNST